MRNVIRLGVAAAGLFVILPAWADGASVVDRQDAQLAQFRGENAELPRYVASAPAPGTPAGEGSGGSEPGDRSQEQDTSKDQKDSPTQAP